MWAACIDHGNGIIWLLKGRHTAGKGIPSIRVNRTMFTTGCSLFQSWSTISQLRLLVVERKRRWRRRRRKKKCVDLFSWYRLQRSTVLHIDAPHPLPATAAIISVVDCCHSSAGLPRSEYRNVLRVAYLKYSVLSFFIQSKTTTTKQIFVLWVN